jgi:hypothetical protein
MSEPNVLTINVVGGGAGQEVPDTPPTTLPPSTQPNPRPRQYRGADDSADLLDETAEASKATIAYVKKVQNNLLTYDEAIGELTRQIKARGLGLTETLRARDVIGTNKTAADHYAGVFARIVEQIARSMPDKSPAAAEAFDASMMPHDAEADTRNKLPTVQPTGNAEAAQLKSAEAVTFYAKKVQDRLLSYDEAMAELLKQVRSRGLALTELLRSQGAIGVGSTAADHYEGALRDAVRAGGGAVPANQAPYRRPVAMPKPDRPVGKPVMSDAEAAEEDRKERAERLAKITAAGIATQNIANGGAGTKIAGAVQLAGSGMLGQGAAKWAGGAGGAAAQVAGIVVDFADNMIRQAGAAARETIQNTGEVAKKIAANDGIGAFTKTVDTAANAMEKIPIVGTAAGQALKVFTTTLNTVNEVVGAFAGRGRELRMYDPAIAQAAANADVKNLKLDMQEAARFSAQYVKMIEGEQRINAAWRRATDPIRFKIMELLEKHGIPLLEKIAARVEGVFNGIEIIQVVIENLPLLIDGEFEKFRNLIEGEVKRIHNDFKKRDDGGVAGKAALDAWISGLGKLKPEPHGPNVNAGDVQLKLPMLKMFGG